MEALRTRIAEHELRNEHGQRHRLQMRLELDADLEPARALVQLDRIAFEAVLAERTGVAQTR